MNSEIEDSFIENTRPKSTNRNLIIRGFVLILGALALLYFNNFFYWRANIFNEKLCCIDQGHVLTSHINNYFRHNITARNVFLIVSALLVDCSILMTLYFWVFKWVDWVLIYSLIMFYGFRGGVIFNLYIVAIPKGFNFNDPGFPSIAVRYGPINDFYYSGHIGFPIIFAQEFFRKGNKLLGIICIAVSMIEGFMMLITRGHYTIDLIFGLVFANYFYKIALLMNPYINQLLCRRFKFCYKSRQPKINFIDIQNVNNQNELTVDFKSIN